MAPVAAQFGRSGPRRRLGVEGKGEGKPAGLIPGRSSGGGGPGRPGRNGGRQRAAGLRAGASGECGGDQGEREEHQGAMGVPFPTSIRAEGQWGGELRGGRRRQWQAAALQARNGGLGWRRWLWSGEAAWAVLL